MQGFVDNLIRRHDALQAFPAEFVYLACQILFCLLVLFAFVAPFGAIVIFVERRVAGRIQSRVGPNRVGPQGILQSVADGLKGIVKEDIIPLGADSLLFRLGPYLVFLGMFLAFAAMPFSSRWVVAEFDAGVFYLLAVESLVVIGIVMSGWASYSKWSLIGGMRGAAQIVSYEVPVTLTVLMIVMLSGTMNIQDIVARQGLYPWQWNVCHSPFTAIAFFVMFTAQLAEGNRTPFDIPEAESELVSGYNTEYSGFRFMVFFLAEFTNLYLIGAFASLLFLGGWQAGPLVTALGLETHWARNLVELAVLQVKALSLVFIIIQLRWTVPRVRIDQLMALCWKYLVPSAFVNLGGVAVWMVFTPEWFGGISAGVMTALGAVIFVYFYARVVYQLRNAKMRLRLNPLS